MGYYTSEFCTDIADSVNEMCDDELGPASRVFFISTARRISQQYSTTPSVNFRGIMDPVSH